MPRDKNVTIHIGCPKTATTTLQHNLFAPLHEKGRLLYLGNCLNSEGPSFYLLKNHIFSVLYDSEKNFRLNLADHQRNLNEMIKKSHCRNIILSDELLSLSYRPEEASVETFNPYRAAVRLKDLFAQYSPQIVITIRSQQSAIYSFFVEWYNWKLAEDKEANTFHKYITKGITDNISGNLRMFYYYELIQKYIEVFGRKSINILVFEKLTSNPHEFYEDLAKIFNIELDAVQNVFDKHHANKKRQSVEGSYARRQSLDIKLTKFIYCMLRNDTLRDTVYGLYQKSNTLRTIYLDIIIPFLRFFTWARPTNIPRPTAEQLAQLKKEFSPGNKKLSDQFRLTLEQYDYL